MSETNTTNDNEVQGLTEEQGIQGLIGEQGTQGIQGATGAQGAQGLQGRTGSQGTTGATGAQGARGKEGWQGAAGSDGTQGIQGARGSDGWQGNIGCRGEIGPQGASGSQGLQGRKGAQGWQGHRGLIGDSGIQGLEGMKGIQGARGEQGPQGIQGPVGIDGNVGYQGQRGNLGVQGIQGPDGLQGFQGNLGVQGPQGTRGDSGPEGAQGYVGLIGAQGAQGAQGTDGVQGHQGFQGNKGLDGADGAQGISGYDGAQGSQGRIGNAGDKGAQGMQGAQGTQGNAGIQGARGCAGDNGAQGVRGMQGVQGNKGAQGAKGFMGAQGIDGPQGIQGPKGKPGEKGYMGYQGDDGEVGIQGVTGEKGSVWVDGIRLNGYNTHLFDYDTTVSKYVSKNANEDLLYIRNGAKIAIWLDEDAYTALSAGSTIPIDRLENGVKIATNYPAYYAGTTTLYSVINVNTDINTVVELTYRNGAWYYSGGLITPTITEDITVTGVELGQLKEGAIVKAGTTLQDLFESLLIKEIDVHTITPKCSILVSGGNLANGSTYEIGETVTGTLSDLYIDGKFVGDTGYTYSIDAGCVKEDSTYYNNGIVMASTHVHILNMTEETITYTMATDYSASTAIPRTNVGNISEKSIAAGTAISSNSITIKGCYKCFYGTQVAATASTIDDPSTYQFTSQDDLEGLSEMWLNASGDSIISSIQTTELLPSFVVIVPMAWDITETFNSLGQPVDVDTTWYKQNTIAYTYNGIETVYQVYVSPSTEKTEYKNITLSK